MDKNANLKRTKKIHHITSNRITDANSKILEMKP